MRRLFAVCVWSLLEVSHGLLLLWACRAVSVYRAQVCATCVQGCEHGPAVVGRVYAQANA
eukprot:1421660-Lingulodinium_polyedra.AAC.1